MHMFHPGLPEFDYIQPASLVEASRYLAEHANEARPFMGGTDTFVRMRDGFWRERHLVDVKGLEGMGKIGFDAQRGLTLGAAVNMNRVIASPQVRDHYPLLAEAARTVASYPLRTRATIVGNIANASPAGDTTGACMVYSAVLAVHGVDGFRQAPLEGFFVGPGKTVLQPGDIVTSILFPIPPKGCAGRYIKLGRNAIGDLAIVGVTVLGFPDDKARSGYRFRIALASVAPVPLRATLAEEMLASDSVHEGTIARAAQAAMEACSPIDDVRASARYRSLMVRNLTRQALLDVWQRVRLSD